MRQKMSDTQTLAMHRRIMSILAERGLKAAGVSRDAGVHHDTIRMMGLGHKKSYDKILRIAQYLGVTVETLAGSGPLDPATLAPATNSPARAAPTPRPRELPRDVPVLGVTLGHDQNGHGLDEYFTMANSEPIDYVRRPPSIQTRRGVYALTVIGTSMEPRFRQGDLIYVDPDTPPKIGDDVVAQIRNGQDRIVGSIIKTLIRRTADKLLLEQYSPACTIELLRSRVAALHRVIPYNELLG
jgi:phage repressor protein C with HTH and peptisase S24 domain/lambda repressor-like predicted transcriptional regulator